MIHSLSGGVIADNTPFLCAKAEAEGEQRWFLSPFPVREGDRVLALFGAQEREGVVIKTEYCTRQTSPVPVRMLVPLLKKLP